MLTISSLRLRLQMKPVNAVYEFYFGTPAIIDVWIVPFNRHPELSYEVTRSAIAQAINVSQATFDGIAERRRERVSGNRLFGKSRWEWALQYQYLPVAHVSDPSLHLQLRRDLQEAYIVHDDTPQG